MNWVSPTKTLSDYSMLWVGTLDVPVRLNIGAENVFWVEVAAMQRGSCRHLFHGSPDEVFNPEIWVWVWTSLSHLHFTHFSYFGGAKKQCRLLSLPIRNRKWRQQQGHFKHEHSKCISFQFIYLFTKRTVYPISTRVWFALRAPLPVVIGTAPLNLMCKMQSETKLLQSNF